MTAEPLIVGIEMISDPTWLGGSIYLRNLVYCLAGLPEGERPSIRLLGVGPQDEAAADLLALPGVEAGMPAGSGAAGRQPTIWARLKRKYLGATLGDKACQEFAGLHATYPAFNPPVKGVPQINWIPDLQHVHLPEFFTAKELKARQEGVARVAAQSGVLVLSSQAALRDFQALHPDARITPMVWPFCTILRENERGGQNPRAAYGLPEKYFYIPNQFWAHKDHATAFKAIALLRQRGLDIPLVCTGLEDDRRNPDYFPSLKKMLAELGVQDLIRFLGLVPRNDQMEIFRHCAAVVQPSLFEGWSTVVEDAKAMGRPLILSDLAVHQEQVGSDGRFFRRSSPEELAEVLEAAWRELPPGPSPQAEQEAEKLGAQRRAQAGVDFLVIVKRAMELHRQAGDGGC